jgi:hemerythrin
MPLMTWNDKLSVGVAALDNVHKKLVSLLNELFDAMNSGHGKDALGKILDGLIEYTKFHFAHEEKLFAQTGYPESDAHKQLHADFARQVLEVQQKYKSGATGTLSLEVMRFLKSWLMDHIQGTDMKYGPYLNGKGIH